MGPSGLHGGRSPGGVGVKHQLHGAVDVDRNAAQMHGDTRERAACGQGTAKDVVSSRPRWEQERWGPGLRSHAQVIRRGPLAASAKCGGSREPQLFSRGELRSQSLRRQNKYGNGFRMPTFPDPKERISKTPKMGSQMTDSLPPRQAIPRCPQVLG